MIECIGVTKYYNTKNKAFLALDNISLNISKGSFTILKGASGSGKTTLLNLIGLLDSPTDGTILFNKKNPNTLNDKELSKLRLNEFGFVFQNFNLISVLSAYENIKYPLVISGKPKTEYDIIDDLMNKLDINSLKHKRPDELSGGQQQRVAIARALVMQPSLILADEPTANLDSKTGINTMEIMTQLSEEFKTTFIIATHDPLVIDFAQNIIELKDGKIERSINEEITV